VNRQLIRVAWVAMALIVALVVGTTYWQTWARPGLAARQDNEIQRVAEFQVRRGLIVSPTRVLARNRALQRKGKTFYFRRYPQGRLAAHVVGYSTISRSRAGLEKSLNGTLTGTDRALSDLVEQRIDRLQGTPIVGDDVVTTLDLRAQKVALEQLGRTCGAVTALDPRSGRLLVMASSPSYDPNLVGSTDTPTIGSHFTANLIGTYRFEARKLDNVEVFLSIDNIADKDPKFSAGGVGGAYPVLYPSVGRSYRLGLRMGF